MKRGLNSPQLSECKFEAWQLFWNLQDRKSLIPKFRIFHLPSSKLPSTNIQSQRTLRCATQIKDARPTSVCLACNARWAAICRKAVTQTDGWTDWQTICRLVPAAAGWLEMSTQIEPIQEAPFTWLAVEEDTIIPKGSDYKSHCYRHL